MWGDQRFAASRPDVLTQVLKGDLIEDYLAVGPVQVELKFSVALDRDSARVASPGRTSNDAQQLDLDLVVKLIDIAPDGTQTLVRGDVCPARWRKSKTSPSSLTPGVPASLSFDMASICHRFAAGHSIALQIQSSWFPLVAMNPQTFLENPHTATAKDYSPVEVSILDGSSIVLGWSRTR